MKIRLTREQTLHLENRMLREVVRDLLHTLEDLSKNPKAKPIVQNAINKAIDKYSATVYR